MASHVVYLFLKVIIKFLDFFLQKSENWVGPDSIQMPKSSNCLKNISKLLEYVRRGNAIA